VCEIAREIDRFNQSHQASDFRHNIRNWFSVTKKLTINKLCQFSEFSGKTLHSHWQIIQHYFLQILSKLVEIQLFYHRIGLQFFSWAHCICSQWCFLWHFYTRNHTVWSQRLHGYRFLEKQYWLSTCTVLEVCDPHVVLLMHSCSQQLEDLQMICILCWLFFSSHVVAMCACCISFIRPHPMEGLCICIGWLQLSNETVRLNKEA